MAALPDLPTVADAGRLALPLGTRLVAGTLGLGRPVRWARTASVLSPLFPVLNADEVALLDLPLVQASHAGLNAARVVRELGRLGLAAIVVKGTLDEAAVREAERSHLPLFTLPEDADVVRIARAIIRLVSDREAQEEAQAAALYRHLSQGVVAGRGVSGLIGEIHRFTTHAAHLSDLEGNILEHAGVAPDHYDELSRPIFVSDAPVALLVLRDREEALDAFSRVALDQGAAALALELSKAEAVEAAREQVQGEFVTSLLLGEADAVLLTRARAATYPLDAAQWVVMAVAAYEQVNEATMRAWLRRAGARAESLGWQTRSTLAVGAVPPGEQAWQATLVLGGGAPGWEPVRAAFVDYLMEIWAGPSSISVGVGEPSRGVEGLRRALGQARDALLLGLRLLGPGRYYLHREMGLYRVLRHLQGSEDLKHFVNTALAALEAYDREHDASLIETLHALLEHGSNISSTARALHLHRNSLVYRIDRIREISGLDPTDPTDAFSLRLALVLAPLR
jgi:PucR family transcriptional regulator, purine catabolism regulatory protein